MVTVVGTIEGPPPGKMRAASGSFQAHRNWKTTGEGMTGTTREARAGSAGLLEPQEPADPPPL